MIPKVSVIIPTYNRAHLIGRAIKSVLNQTFQDFEIIIVDDGSIDNTEEVIKEFQKKDDRIKYIKHRKNKGEGAARNTGIKISNSPFIAFQDSDDESFPEKLEKQINVFQAESSKLGIVYTSMYRIDKQGKKHNIYTPTIMPKDGFFYKKALDYQVLNIGIGTAIVRRTCFNVVGLFDERLPYFVDLDFFIRLSKNYYFYHINELLINYHDAGNNKDVNSNKSYKNLLISRQLILDKYFIDIRKDKKILAKHYYNIGNSLYSCGMYTEAKSYFMKACKKNPLNVMFLLVAATSLFGQKTFNAVSKVYLNIKKSKINIWK